jgi:hypothetical protein
MPVRDRPPTLRAVTIKRFDAAVVACSLNAEPHITTAVSTGPRRIPEFRVVERHERVRDAMKERGLRSP